MSHTPGPLMVRETTSKKWDEIGDYAIFDTERQIIGEAFSRTSREENSSPARANATLWAAAPDLYIAAKGIIAAFECQAFVRNTLLDHESDWAIKALPHMRALALLTQAIEKADGQEIS